jgi:hypothetical protein
MLSDLLEDSSFPLTGIHAIVSIQNLLHSLKGLVKFVIVELVSLVAMHAKDHSEQSLLMLVQVDALLIQ